VVLALFAILAWACYRLVARSDDAFVRIATAGVMAWIIGQALINVGAVIGMLPVIGVPLPLVSSGGTALLTTMFALGILLSFARQEPDCRAALAGRPSLLRRSLVVVPRLRSRTRSGQPIGPRDR
jgi:cell division protein FtsW